MTENPERGSALRFRVELPFARAHAEIAGLVNEVNRRAAWGGPPDQRPAESADEERLALVPGDVSGGAPDPLESLFDIEQRKFARNLSVRFSAKGARVRDLARRDAMGPFREVVAPRPYAVARWQVVRGKMDLHGHPSGAAQNPKQIILKLTAWVRPAARPRVGAVFEGSRPAPLSPSGLRRPAPPRAGCGGRGRRNLCVEEDPDGPLNSLSAASAHLKVGSALNETSCGVQ